MIPRLRPGNGARLSAAFIAVGSVGLVIRAAGALRPGERLAGLTMIAAIIWSTAPFLLDTALGWAAKKGTPRSRNSNGVITTVVRLGETPVEVARSAIEVAAGQGPTIVVSESQPGAVDLFANIPVTVIDSFAQVAKLAEEKFGSDAIVIVGPDCVPVLPACRAVAADLGEDAAWVTGRARGMTAEVSPRANANISADTSGVPLVERASFSGSRMPPWSRPGCSLRTPSGPRRSWATGFGGLRPTVITELTKN